MKKIFIILLVCLMCGLSTAFADGFNETGGGVTYTGTADEIEIIGTNVGIVDNPIIPSMSMSTIAVAEQARFKEVSFSTIATAQVDNTEGSFIKDCSVNSCLIIRPRFGYFVGIGTCVTSNHGLGYGDTILGGQLEVDGNVFFDDDVTCYGDLKMRDNRELRLGNGGDAQLGWQTAQTPDSATLGLGSDSNVFIMCETADTNYDFAHALEQHPKMFFQSKNQSATEWGSLTHDTTYFTINAGKDGVQIANHCIIAGNLTVVDSTLTISGATSVLEFENATATIKGMDLLIIDGDVVITGISTDDYYFMDGSTDEVTALGTDNWVAINTVWTVCSSDGFTQSGSTLTLTGIASSRLFSYIAPMSIQAPGGGGSDGDVGLSINGAEPANIQHYELAGTEIANITIGCAIMLSTSDTICVMITDTAGDDITVLEINFMIESK